MKGKYYPDKSSIPLGSIGIDDDALLCVTTNNNCCRNADNSRRGELGIWRFPDGTVPDDMGTATTAMTIARHAYQILLHRPSGVVAPVGIYTCEVPDTNGSSTKLLQVYLFYHLLGEW